MDDGSELPPGVGLERVCGGIARIEGFANADGYFTLQLGSGGADAFQDASTAGIAGLSGGQPGVSGFPGSSAPRSQPLTNCELRARVAGYQSQSVDLGAHGSFDNPDVGTILLHRVAATEGTTVSVTSLTAPKKAQRALRRGLAMVAKKKPEPARTAFQRAVNLDPKFAEAWFQLGRVQAAQGQTAAARRSFEAAIRADDHYLPPYLEVAILDWSAQRWQELADVSDKAVRLDSFSFPQAFFFNAIANYNLHRAEAAEQSARRARKLDTRHRFPQISWLLGLILAGRHEYSEAASAMREYLNLAPQAGDAAVVRAQLEAIEKKSPKPPPAAP